MKTLYFECNMGAAGDMLLSALTDLMPDEKSIISKNYSTSENERTNNTNILISKEKFIEQLNNAGIPGVKYILTKGQKCGIYGTKVIVTVNGVEEESIDINREHSHTHDHEHYHHDCDASCDHHHTHSHEHSHTHHHSGLDDIEEIIENLKLPSMVKMDAIAVYNLIAEAEGAAHNCTIKDIHFHEVGTMDAIADIVGVCLAMYRIKADKIMASPIHVGSGQVRCAHGILPVPAPATAYILKDAPIYGGSVKGELCTPTGAALIKYFVLKYGAMPIMTVKNTGIGCGTKDFDQANIVRVMLGDVFEENTNDSVNAINADMSDNLKVSDLASMVSDDNTDVIYELSCNVDDMTGEEIAFATQTLLEEGALDVYTIAIGMKKNRPGIMINCICKPDDRLKFAKLIFKNTSTLGIREKRMDRYILKRESKDVQTDQGLVRVKHSFGYGSDMEKIEYDDLKNIAMKNNEGLLTIKKML